jgi:prolipoprotein diacylglyceryltransferase
VALFGMRIVIETIKENQVGFEDGMAFNMGQLLSVPFVIAGIVFIYMSYKKKFSSEIFLDKKK